MQVQEVQVQHLVYLCVAGAPYLEVLAGRGELAAAVHPRTGRRSETSQPF